MNMEEVEVIEISSTDEEEELSAPGEVTSGEVTPVSEGQDEPLDLMETEECLAEEELMVTSPPAPLPANNLVVLGH